MIEVFKDQWSTTSQEWVRQAVARVLNCQVDGLQPIHFEPAKGIEKVRSVAPCKIIIEITDDAIKESKVLHELEHTRKDLNLNLTNQRTPSSAKVTMLKLKVMTKKEPLGIEKSFPSCVMIVAEDMKQADYGIKLREIEIVVLGFEAHEITSPTLNLPGTQEPQKGP
jgi:hypothetical protein